MQWQIGLYYRKHCKAREVPRRNFVMSFVWEIDFLHILWSALSTCYMVSSFITALLDPASYLQSHSTEPISFNFLIRLFTIFLQGVSWNPLFFALSQQLLYMLLKIFTIINILSSLRHYIYNSCGQRIIWICRKAVTENLVILRYLFFFEQ